jgi:hypothetical protein
VVLSRFGLAHFRVDFVELFVNIGHHFLLLLDRQRLVSVAIVLGEKGVDLSFTEAFFLLKKKKQNSPTILVNSL